MQKCITVIQIFLFLDENIFIHREFNAGEFVKTQKFMDEFFKSICRAIVDMATNAYAVLSGLFVSALGYFLPVRDMVHLLILFFLLDVIFGYWAARKLRQERFKVSIIWTTTIPRMLLSLVLILGAFMWDKTYNQEFVSTYKIIGWFISGVLLYSIAENGYHITKWSVFPKLGQLFRSKVKDQTGLDVKESSGETS